MNAKLIQKISSFFGAGQSDSSLKVDTQPQQTTESSSGMKAGQNFGMALEPRIMLDAAIIATGSEVQEDMGSQGQPTEAGGNQQASEEQLLEAFAPLAAGPAREVILVDPSVSDYQTLLEGLPAGVDVHILSESATLSEISDVLSGYNDLDAVHLISHGGTGSLNLGGETVTESTLQDQQQILTAIGQSLNENGDILLYGCNVGGDESGQSFIDLFAAMTSADVAASDDLTGVGGDWELEVEEGEVEASVVIAESAQSAYSFNLANPVLTINNGTPATFNEYTAGDNPIQLDATATLTDADDDWNGASLEFEVTSNYVSGDNLGIFSADVYVDGTDLKRNSDDAVIATVPAMLQAGNTPYTITFNATATAADVQNTARALVFQTQSQNPTNAQRTVTITAYDAANNSSGAQTRTINVVPSNDAPTVSAALTGGVNEGATSTNFNLLSGATDAEGQSMSVTSVTYTVGGTATGNAGADLPAGVTLSGSTLTIDPTNAAFDDLAASATRDIVASYTISDGNGGTVSQSQTITVTGTNDNPVVAAALTGGVNEGATSTNFNLLSGATDAEGQSMSVTSVTYTVGGTATGNAGADLPAGVTLSGSTLTIDPTNAAFDDLAASATRDIVASYTISDGNGGTVSQSQTITVTGTNDNPVVAAALTGGVNEGATSTNFNLLSGATDAEGQSMSVTSVTYTVGGTATGNAGADLPAGVTLSGSTLTIDPTNAAFDDLAASATRDIVASYTISDGNGGTVSQSQTITVTGTNDNPVVAAALTGGVNEGATSTNFNLLSGATDAEGQSMSVTSVTYTVGGTATGNAGADLPAGVTLSGSTLTIDPTNAAFDDLAASATRDIVASYTISDGNGGTVSQSQTITVTGTNDNPVVAAALTGGVNEGATSTNFNLLSGATDAEGQSMSVTSVTYTVGGTATGNAGADLPAGVTLSGSTLTIDPTNAAFDDLAASATRDIVASYTISDGNGGTVSQSQTITVTGTNDNPVLSGLGTTLAFTEDDGATVIDSDITITDVDDTHIESVTIQITSNYQNGQDVLSIDSVDVLSGVTVTPFDTSTGTLVLTADVANTITKAQFEAMLEKVKYNNTSQHPNTSDRTVTWTVNDGTLNSVNSGRTSTIEITRLNDAPVLDNSQSPAMVAVDEDSRPVNGSTAGSTLISALAGGISDVDTGDATGIAINAVDSNGTLYYSADGSGSSWTEVTATLSDTNALLLSSTARIYFKPNSDHDQNVSTAITFRAWDQTSGTNGATADTSTNGLTTAFSTDTDTVSLTVNPVSDAPHFSGNGSLAAINEDATASGATVTSLFSSLFQDVDTGDSMLGIAITNDASDNSDGTWQYSTDSGTTWYDIGLVANNAGLLLSNTAMLRFNPALNFNGAPGALTVHAVDNSAVDPVEFTSGTTRELFDTTGDNAESHVSIAGVLLETSVTAQNDAPTLTGGYNARMPNVPEDAGVPSGSDGVLLSTVVNAAGNDVDANSGIQGVAISAVSSDGRLYYSTDNGASWSYIGDDQDLATNEYLLLDGSARIYFKPDANFNGAVSDAFTFHAWDASDSRSQGLHTIASLPTGGTEAYSSTTLDVAIDVVAGNDAPTATDNTFPISEDGSYTFAAANFGYSDTEGSPLDSITITSLPGQGSLTLNGVAVTANQVIDASSIGDLVFTPATNANGANYASFQFTVSDGSLDSVTPNTITFNVNAVNDLPTGTDDTITVLEDGSHPFTAADFGYSDVEGSSLDRVQITSLPVSGTLQLSGTNVAPNDEIAFANIGNLVFTPAANANGAGYASIGFKVHDGTAFSAAANTLTIDVTADNDAPTASNQSVTLTEDGSHTFASSEFDFNDIDTGDSLSSIRITSLPGAGSLTLNNASVSMGQVIAESDIENLVFTPAADGNGAGYATFQFRVNDGTVDSASLYTMTMNVNGVNDAPSFTGPASLPVTEDATNPAGATVTSLFGSLFQDSADSNTMIGIAIAGDASTASEGIWQYTTDGTTWLAIGTVSSSGALLLDNAANTKLRFVPAANYDGVSGALTVHAVENSGTAPTFTSGSTQQTFNTDTDDATSNVSASGVDLTASVNNVNDKPTFSSGATLGSVDEDTTSPSGSTLSDLFGSLFQDNDGGDSFDGIAIVADAATTAQGNWEYTTDGSTWHDLGAVSTSAAVLLENTANTKLRFVPTANYKGTPGALTVHAVDSTYSGSYTSGATQVDFNTTSDATDSAVSQAGVSLGTSINSVNDAPIFNGSASLGAVNEDTTNPAGATVTSLFNSLFSNTEDPLESLQGIVITVDNSDGSQGVWQYKVGAGSWTDLGVVAQNAGLMLSSSSMLRFVPASHFNGTPGSLHVHAVDNSDSSQTYTGASRVVFDTTTDNQESNVSQAAVLLGTSITSENDAPVLSNTNLTLPNLSEDAGTPVGAVGLQVSDLTGGASDMEESNLGIAVTGVNANGSLHYSLDNGANWHSVSTAPSNSAAILFSSTTRLYFQPNAGYNGYSGDAITFHAWDGTSGTATNSGTPSTVSTVTNGDATAFSSATDDVAITILSVNDAPTFTFNSANTGLTVSEDAGAQTVTGFITASSTSDTGDALTAYNITTSNNAAFASLPAIDTSNGQLTYTLAANWNGAVTVTVTLTDNGGTANGGVDTSAAQTFTITANAVNDAPTLADSNLSLPNVNEDPGDPVGSVGRLVSELTGAASDVEGTVAGIAVTAVHSNGTLYYSLDNGSNWHSVSAASASASVLFSSSTRLYFKPDANFNTNLGDAFTFRAWDGTSGAATSSSTISTENTSTNGAATAFSSATDTVAQTIISVNDVPSFSIAGNQTVNEDAGAQTVSSFATSIDANDVGQTLTSFNITTSNDAAFASLPAIDTSTGQLTYTLADNWYGAVSVTVTLTDSGGTANGGIDTSAPQTFTITANAVNDAPVLDHTQSPSLPNIDEDAADPVGRVGQMVSTLLAGASDVEGETLGIAVTEVSTLGTLWYSLDGGANWLSTNAAARSDSSALLLNNTALVYFQGSADEHGSIADAITFRAWDGTGTDVNPTHINGGTADTSGSNSGTSTAFSSVTDTVAITIISVNDVPQFTIGADQTIQEDVDGLIPTQVTVSGFASGISQGFTGTTTNEGSQTLTFNVATDNDAAFNVGPAIDSTSGNLTYTLNQDWNGGPITVTVTLSDDGGTDNGGVSVSDPQTFTITATPVNDAPVLSDSSLAFTHMTEDGANDPVGEVGRLVSEFTDAATDVDHDDSTLGIAITGINQYVTLWYGIQGDSSNWVWTAVNSADVAGNNALMLSSTARVYLQSKPDVNTGATADHTPGTVDPIAAAVTFRAWDGSNGSINSDGSNSLNGTKADASTHGTTTAFSSFEEQISAMIDPAVDIADDSETFAEDISTVIDVWANDSFDSSAQITDITGTTGANGVTVTDNGNGTYTLHDPNDPIDPNDLSQGYRLIGTIVLSTDGNGVANRVLTFNPAEDWHSNGNSKAFSYTVTSENNTETATVTVDVTSVVDVNANNGIADTQPVAEDGTVTTNVLTNDSFGSNATVTSVTQGANGTVTFTAAGDITYEPNADFYGTDSYTYTVTTASGNTETATVTVTVNPVTDAVDNTLNINEDNAGTINVLANDSFDSSAVVSGVTQGNNGSVTFTASGDVTYTPATNFNGTDSFTYTVTSGGVTETATVNVTVSAAVDVVADTIITNEDTAQTINVLTNDSFGVDPGSTVTSVSQGTNGTVTFQANGTVVYTPNANFNGTDSFTYTVSSTSGTTPVTVTETGTVNVTVNSVNDVPSFTLPASPNQTILEDAGAQPYVGFAGSISMGPADEQTGGANAQTPTFLVTTDNDSAFAAGGLPAINANGDLTYTMADDWNGGPITVTVRLQDSGGTAPGGVDTSAAQTFTIDVAAVNDVPSFNLAGNHIVLEDSGTNSVANFASAISKGPANENSQNLTFTLTTDNDAAFASGPAIDATTGELTYTLNEHWNGVVNVTVVLSDDGGTTDGGVDTAASQSFVINVAPVNDAPSFVGGSGLIGIDSITEVPTGQTVNELFDHLFEDPFDHQSNDGSHGFAGIAITGNNANPETEGSWEYSTDDGATWFEVGNVSAENALLLEHTQTVKLRFMPVYTFTGEPGLLAIHAVDDSTTEAWTTGDKPVYYDTTTDDHRDHVSQAEVDLTTSASGKIHVITHFSDGHSTDRQVTEPSVESPVSQAEPVAHEVAGDSSEQTAPTELVTSHDDDPSDVDHHTRSTQRINERYSSQLVTGTDNTDMDSRRDSTDESVAAAWAETVNGWTDRQLSELEEEEKQTQAPASETKAQPIKPEQEQPEKEKPAQNSNDKTEEQPEAVEQKEASASGLSRQLAEEAESNTQSLSQLVEALEALNNESNTTNRRL